MGTNDRLLKIIKASAGSGKTYTLTQEYLNLLLNGGRDAYKHILAVTFTNKATDEMKSRIVEALYELSLEDSQKGIKAKRILKDILNDYSNFSISTIDRFFQTAMRSFAKEIGQFASYRVELDSDSVLSQSVDIMMSSLDEAGNEELLKWLTEYSFSIMERGKSWNLTPELLSMSKLFLKEDFKVLRDKFAAASMSKDQMKKYIDKMREIVSDFEKKLRKIGEDALKIMEDEGLSYSDYYKGSKGPFSYFEKWKSGEVKEPTYTFVDLHNAIEKWSTQKAKPHIKIAIESTYNNGLNDLVGKAIDHFKASYTNYRSAKVILSNVYVVGIFADIYGVMNQFLKDNNIVLLGETTDVLSRIIDGSDTPFIYEKLGVRYDHIMLDEFQDTSLLQWNNFKPLYANGMAAGKKELVVGDVKQSIYRWRGSDWNLLNSKIDGDFAQSSIEKNNLEFNWRSCDNIVQFNNDFFSNLGSIVKQYDEKIGEKVTSIYQDCSQKTPQKLLSELGHVKVQFVKDDKKDKKRDVQTEEKDSQTEEAADVQTKTMDLVLEDIRSLREAGYQLKDIAILVRTNKEGSKIATFLLDNGYTIITDDSLAISTSEIVSKVVSILKYLINPEDPINGLILEECGVTISDLSQSILSLRSDSLYSLCEEIIHQYVGEVPSSEIPFVQGFLDMVVDYVSKYGSNIRGFIRYWDEKGRLLSIAAPEGQNAIRIMTIHKSKGLGFDVVIVPFFKEKFAPDNNKIPYIWCAPSAQQFSQIGLIPLKASKSSLGNTIFEDDLKKELLCYCVDSINTAYVALTRAKKELIIYASEPKSNKDGNTNSSVADALYCYLTNKYGMNESFEFGEWWNVEKEDKDDQKQAVMKQSTIETFQNSFVTIPLSDSKLSLSLRGRDFFEEDGSKRTRGIVLHDILSRIDTEADLEKAVGDAVYSGEIAANTQAETLSFLKSKIIEISDKHWFDGTYRSLNEISVIDADGTVHRPDRVLESREESIKERTAIVIDYKFGKPRPAYQKQINNYVQLLQQMGYRSVKGEIWYVDE